jgi:hypothetical protein
MWSIAPLGNEIRYRVIFTTPFSAACSGRPLRGAVCSPRVAEPWCGRSSLSSRSLCGHRQSADSTRVVAAGDLGRAGLLSLTGYRRARVPARQRVCIARRSLDELALATRFKGAFAFHLIAPVGAVLRLDPPAVAGHVSAGATFCDDAFQLVLAYRFP